MTIDRNDKITLPKWLVILIVPLLVGGLGGLGTSLFTMGSHVNQIEVNTKHIEVLEANKANKESYDMIVKSLDRIENKLDNHIAEKHSK